MYNDQKSFAELIAEAKKLQKKENGKVKGGYIVIPIQKQDEVQEATGLLNLRCVVIKNKCKVVINPDK